MGGVPECYLPSLFSSCRGEFFEVAVGLAHWVESKVDSLVAALDPPYVETPSRRVGRAPQPHCQSLLGLRERGPPTLPQPRESKLGPRGPHLAHPPTMRRLMSR